MTATGPARPSLTAQLQEKIRADREQIEALTRTELQQLAESLSRSSKAALDAIETDTNVRLRGMRDRLNGIESQQRRWPLWTALSCMGVAAALSTMLWMASSWKRSELRGAIEQLSTVRTSLEDLQQMTGGLRIATVETGPPVLVVPYNGGDFYLCGPEGSLLCLPLDRTRILTGPRPTPRPGESESPATTSGTE